MIGVPDRGANEHGSTPADLLCLSHLRWGFVYQRPNHLMARFARERRVFFIEEPVFDAEDAWIETTIPATGVTVITPHVARDLTSETADAPRERLLEQVLREHGIERYIAWYSSPMAVAWTRRLRPVATVYDCMDELAAFADAPTTIAEREGELLDSADLVFTGGMSLYEAKRDHHARVHPFPSGVDVAHFARAREPGEDPEDQREIPHPRVGFYGVIDERLDVDLLADVAARRPDVHFVMVGPIAKIDEATLPTAPNLHFLGPRSYDELPDVLRAWDVAMLPFAMNDATRFISPTKTPEYLAAGRPVVSTPVRDVVRPYGELGLVEIADDGPAFVAAIDRALERDRDELTRAADPLLATMSWDATFSAMRELILDAIERREARSVRPVVVGMHRDRASSDAGDGGHREARHGLRLATRPRGFDWMVVGAGFAGAVLAERLASQTGASVLVVERRDHIGGNAFDEYDDDGILIHRYGPHIFHTNSEPVFEHLSRFTAWRDYEHRVLASVDGQLVPMPINLDTINRLYGLNLTSFEVQGFLDGIREPVEHPRTSEDVVVNAVGRELYEKFFRNYTRKQWGLDPSELDASVTARVPTRTTRDDRYFTDRFQAMPLHGYTRMFRRMLDHPNIKVLLNTDYRDVVDLIPFGEMIYTGPIDAFFDHRYGALPYRSLDFRFETRDEPVHQPAPVINHPNEHAYTRVTEFKYLTGQEHRKTSLVYEYPRADGDPYYPIPRPENARLFKRYKALAERTPGVHFVGRLATYKYYNMDQVVAQALAVFERLRERPADRPVSGDGVADGAIVSPARAVGWDRVHPQPGRDPMLRPTRP